MKIQHLIPILFLAAFCTVSAQMNNAPGYSSGLALNAHPGKNMMATIKSESLDQSIKLLIDDREQYFFPFVPRSIVGGQEDMEQILTTWRLAKVLQEIKELPRSDGDAKCEKLFSTAFQLHTNICRAMIRSATDPSFTNHESILGTRMGMAAAMFIAADTTRLEILKKQFEMLDHWRTEIEPLAKQPDRRFVGRVDVPALSVMAIAPDFRLQVNVLRLAAWRSGNSDILKEVDEACTSIQMKSETVHLVTWNAETATDELPPPDSPLYPNKLVAAYTFYDWNDAMSLNYANTIFHTNSYDLPGISAEQKFVKKLESIVFRGLRNPDNTHL